MPHRIFQMKKADWLHRSFAKDTLEFYFFSSFVIFDADVTRDLLKKVEQSAQILTYPTTPLQRLEYRLTLHY